MSFNALSASVIREFTAEERKKSRCKQSATLGFADILRLLEGPGQRWDKSER